MGRQRKTQRGTTPLRRAPSGKEPYEEAIKSLRDAAAFAPRPWHTFELPHHVEPLLRVSAMDEWLGWPLGRAQARENIERVLDWFVLLRHATRATTAISQMEVDRAWFNPYMAGQILLTITMEVGLSLGLTTIDNIGQARFVLHFYNALRVLDKIPPNSDLDNLATMFERGKSVWVGGRPTARGSFVRSYLLAWGYDTKTSAALGANLGSDLQDYKAKAALRDRMDHRSVAKKMAYRVQECMRKMLLTEPDAVSKAYRYVTHMTAPAYDANTCLVRSFDIIDVLQSDYDAFLYLDFNRISQIFRCAWRDMIEAFDFRGYVVNGNSVTCIQGPRPVRDALPRLRDETLFLQSLLGLCDREPNDDRVALAAEILTTVANSMHEAYIETPLVLQHSTK
ncbi:hypothetical protein SDRG_16942 [Saprolegnia diclina VS20]|uniref:Uncharacterized protein n=1 Tax=Saprolegnia diclina (strain VS20) TaxID=1156394 RepID=T0PSG6_SAPDV|nr:hypothetical protein SDRG_16942 [Saprolegnia diclina VS20]EQC25191.1 hypothetical protein SDRG_16942 [Saprolegnia diclina VS20]|eukprot:XP_008621390.1 hypothetical protein SDRG_16942 [Saprolegnia diclina VS20]